MGALFKFAFAFTGSSKHSSIASNKSKFLWMIFLSVMSLVYSSWEEETERAERSGSGYCCRDTSRCCYIWSGKEVGERWGGEE